MAGEACDEVPERVRHRLQEGGRDADGQGRPERVAQAGGVLDDGPPLLPRDPHRDDAAF